MNVVREFPWRALDRTTREDVVALAFVRQAASSIVKSDAIAHAASEITKTRVAFRLRSVRGDARPLAASVAAIVAVSDGERSRAVLVEAETSLAATLVTRALDRTPPSWIDPSHGPSDRLAGAFAALIIAATRKAHAGSPLRILSAGDAEAIAPTFAPKRERATATFTVLVDDNAHVARVSFPREDALVARSPIFSAESLTSLESVRLSLPIVACTSITNAHDLARLAVGDVWLPGTWSLARSSNGAWHGEVNLAPASGNGSLTAMLGSNGGLVLRATAGEMAKESEMDSTRGSAKNVVEALADAPIVVRVEIGEAEMSARAWAALGEGGVISLGRKIGEPVVLRVGTTEIARGELVEIDGEVGVRIVSLRGGAG